jgi:hypothetical protein
VGLPASSAIHAELGSEPDLLEDCRGSCMFAGVLAENTICSGISWSARITPLGDLSERQVSDGSHPSENRCTRADAARGSVRERLADHSAARLKEASLHEVPSTQSSAKGCLPFFPLRLDLRLQTRRKSSRCQRSSVSGWTIISAVFQLGSLLAMRTSSARSRQVSVGRFTRRCSTMSERGYLP